MDASTVTWQLARKANCQAPLDTYWLKSLGGVTICDVTGLCVSDYTEVENTALNLNNGREWQPVLSVRGTARRKDVPKLSPADEPKGNSKAASQGQNVPGVSVTASSASRGLCWASGKQLRSQGTPCLHLRKMLCADVAQCLQHGKYLSIT